MTGGAADALPEGRHRLRFEFEPVGQSASPKARGSGRAQLNVDGQLIAHDEFLFTTPSLTWSPTGRL